MFKSLVSELCAGDQMWLSNEFSHTLATARDARDSRATPTPT
jgi:hypothetical protein